MSLTGLKYNSEFIRDFLDKDQSSYESVLNLFIIENRILTKEDVRTNCMNF